MRNGIINVNKPSGCTSQHVVSVIKRIYSTRDVGHMGTLDPQGEGVLLVGIGKSTRLFDVLLNKDKIYEATFLFGHETDTLDKDGKIIAETKSIPTKQQIIDKLSSLVGELDQLPPKYSAKNINGKRAYDLARNGIDFVLNPSKVSVYAFDCINETGINEYKFRIHCSSGTYIRSLCRDLAYFLDSLATMTSIKRTKCGEFTIDDSLSINKIEEIKDDAIIPVEVVLKNLPKIEFPEDLYKKISCGVSFPVDYNVEGPFTVYCKNEFFGIGSISTDDNMFKIKTFLKDDQN